MPKYDFRCADCGETFEQFVKMSDDTPRCPDCESLNVERLITSAPSVAGGMLTHAGDGKKASQEELKDKWREETPRLRKKLRDKLGEDAVKDIPSLNQDI